MYDSDKTSFMAYLDVANLYESAMWSSLSMSEFRWLSERELETFKILDIPNESDYGIDMKYSETLHNKHADLPILSTKYCPPNSKSKVPKLIISKKVAKYGLIVEKIHWY